MKKLILLFILACIPSICLASSIADAPTLGIGLQLNQSTSSYGYYGSETISYPSFYIALELPVIKDRCEWDFNASKADYSYSGISVSQMSFGTSVRIALK